MSETNREVLASQDDYQYGFIDKDISIFDTGKGLSADIQCFSKKDKDIVISGKLGGISRSQDWDSAYNSVSSVVQFLE